MTHAHTKKVCECGIVLEQCRCASPDKSTWVVRPCVHISAKRVTIPIRLANAMEVNGVKTLEELGALGTKTIARWKNCGTGTVLLVKRLLYQHGIADEHPWIGGDSGTTIPVKRES